MPTYQTGKTRVPSLSPYKSLNIGTLTLERGRMSGVLLMRGISRSGSSLLTATGEKDTGNVTCYFNALCLLFNISFSPCVVLQTSSCIHLDMECWRESYPQGLFGHLTGFSMILSWVVPIWQGSSRWKNPECRLCEHFQRSKNQCLCPGLCPSLVSFWCLLCDWNLHPGEADGSLGRVHTPHHEHQRGRPEVHDQP